jgi:hypothetical protein
MDMLDNLTYNKEKEKNRNKASNWNKNNAKI